MGNSMLRKIVVFVMISAMVITGIGCTQTSVNTSEIEPTPEITNEIEYQETDTNPTPEEDQKNENSTTLESIGDVEVDSGIFNVTLTIPADTIGEVTQQELDESLDENHFKSATLNSDGSVEYVMSKSAHKEMMDEFAANFNNSLDEMLTSGDYPSFIAIDVNDDYTLFTVTITADELSMAESFSTMMFYMVGGLYNIYNGTPVDNIQVDYVSDETNEIIDTANSNDMG